MTTQEANRDIAGQLAMAKEYRGMNMPDIAKACDIAPSTLSNKKSDKELYMLSFWAVSVIAKLAGYRIEFVPERR